MNVSLTLSAQEFSTADKQLLKHCLSITSDADFAAAMKKLCKAATMEYIKMFKQRGLPTRADEVQQERLYFLLKHYFDQVVPCEREVSAIFQLTPAQSKTLLRNTKVKYRADLDAAIKNTLLAVLNSSVLNAQTGEREFVCYSPNTIEDLNMIVAEKGPAHEVITKMRGLASKYSCPVDTYNLLHQELA